MWIPKSRYIEKKAGDLTCCFREDSKGREFLEKGYVVIPKAVSLHAIQRIFSFSTDFDTALQGDFVYSTMLHSLNQNLELHESVTQELGSTLDALFHEYKAFSTTYLIKPSMGKEMNLHQDWSFTDERQYASITLWLPLQDVSIKNGCVFLLPSSHLFFNNIRSHTLPTTRLDRKHFEKHIVSVEMSQGDLLLFNPAVFHGSYANQTNNHRKVISMVILPEKAPFYYYNKIDHRRVNAVELEEQAFLEQMKKFNESGEGLDGPMSKTIRYRHKMISVKDIMIKYK